MPSNELSPKNPEYQQRKLDLLGSLNKLQASKQDNVRTMATKLKENLDLGKLNIIFYKGGLPGKPNLMTDFIPSEIGINTIIVDVNAMPKAPKHKHRSGNIKQQGNSDKHDSTEFMADLVRTGTIANIAIEDPEEYAASITKLYVKGLMEQQSYLQNYPTAPSLRRTNLLETLLGDRLAYDLSLDQFKESVEGFIATYASSLPDLQDKLRKGTTPEQFIVLRERAIRNLEKTNSRTIPEPKNNSYTQREIFKILVTEYEAEIPFEKRLVDIYNIWQANYVKPILDTTRMSEIFESMNQQVYFAKAIARGLGMNLFEAEAFFMHFSRLIPFHGIDIIDRTISQMQDGGEKEYYLSEATMMRTESINRSKLANESMQSSVASAMSIGIEENVANNWQLTIKQLAEEITDMLYSDQPPSGENIKHWKEMMQLARSKMLPEFLTLTNDAQEHTQRTTNNGIYT